MSETHWYRVEGSHSGRTDESAWETILETSDPVEAMDCAHYVEGWFWRRVIEDGQTVIDRM